MPSVSVTLHCPELDADGSFIHMRDVLGCFSFCPERRGRQSMTTDNNNHYKPLQPPITHIHTCI